MKVLITQKLPVEDLARYFGGCELEINQGDSPLSPEELKTIIVDKDGLLCVGDRIDQALIDAAPRLKVISNFGVGYDNIDLDYAAQKGIIVTNLPHEVTQSTAEMTWALLLTLVRRTAEADAYVRSREFFPTGPGVMLGTNLYGKRLGIIGLGRIGTEVARRAIPFGMEVVHHSLQWVDDKDLVIPCLSLTELLSTSDVITIHVPLTTGTYHLLDTEEFNLMKKTAFVINIARGPVINENALITALRDGKIKGAALDVFEKEPFVPQALREMRNVILTPHLGTAAYETRAAMAKTAAQAIMTVFKGGRPANIVN